MIQLIETYSCPCDECGAEGKGAGVQLLCVTARTVVVECLALCPKCRLVAEAALRASRKHGPRVPKKAMRQTAEV